MADVAENTIHQERFLLINHLSSNYSVFLMRILEPELQVCVYIHVCVLKSFNPALIFKVDRRNLINL